MTPKEKANKLVDLFTFTCREWDFEDNSKKCALIAVDEILESHNKFLSGNNTLIYKYYQEVKSEIERL
jgi:hypothetical protein